MAEGMTSALHAKMIGAAFNLVSGNSLRERFVNAKAMVVRYDKEVTARSVAHLRSRAAHFHKEGLHETGFAFEQAADEVEGLAP